MKVTPTPADVYNRIPEYEKKAGHYLTCLLGTGGISDEGLGRLLSAAFLNGVEDAGSAVEEWLEKPRVVSLEIDEDLIRNAIIWGLAQKRKERVQEACPKLCGAIGLSYNPQIYKKFCFFYESGVSWISPLLIIAILAFLEA